VVENTLRFGRRGGRRGRRRGSQAWDRQPRRVPWVVELTVTPGLGNECGGGGYARADTVVLECVAARADGVASAAGAVASRASRVARDAAWPRPPFGVAGAAGRAAQVRHSAAYTADAQAPP